MADKNKIIDFIRRPTLRLSINVIFTCLFLIMIVSIILYTYYNNSRSTLSISHEILKNNTAIVVEKTSNYLNSAAVLTRLRSVLYKKHIMNIDEKEKFKSLCVEFLRTYPQFKEFSYGDENGNMYGAERRNDGIINRFQITGNPFNPLKADLQYSFVDPDDRVIKVEKKTREYDPRTRPWYMGAAAKKGTYWSDVFVFITDKMQMGITVSHPLYGLDNRLSGVMTADLEIEELSNFMRQLKIGKTGFGFIINEKTEIIAYPDFSRAIVKEGSGLRLKKVNELGYAWLNNAVNLHLKTGKNIFTVNDPAEDNNKIVSFESFPEIFGKSWKIIIAVPEDDFIGSLKETNRYSLLLSVIILAASLVLISRISRGISRPITKLTDETNKITDLDLDGDINISSPIMEIQMISNSVSRLKSGMRAFNKYVPSSLVKQLIQTGEEVRLGGRNEELTILFSDIRGFTSISEKLTPEELMVHLSEYLDALTQIIMECGGTVDKYIGDAIMAFWGAPVADADHAARACTAAVLCQRRISELNDSWERDNKPALHTRIGINTGDTVVGNMGSGDRMNYTIIGDSVNLASRLEGVNSLYGTGIIISDKTQKRVRDRFITRPLDYIVVKGKTRVVRIYELIDIIDENSAHLRRMANAFTSAFNLYRKKEFVKALIIFKKIHQNFPDDTVTADFILKCGRYIKNPPDRKDWMVNVLNKK